MDKIIVRAARNLGGFDLDPALLARAARFLARATTDDPTLVAQAGSFLKGRND